MFINIEMDPYLYSTCIVVPHGKVWNPCCRQEFLRIYELMKLQIFNIEMNQFQSQIYYNPVSVCIMPKNIKINISEKDS